MWLCEAGLVPGLTKPCDKNLVHLPEMSIQLKEPNRKKMPHFYMTAQMAAECMSSDFSGHTEMMKDS